MKELTKRQKEIIEASIQLISKKSIQGLTIKNLAIQLGVTEGALYRHFRSKFEILLAILSGIEIEAEMALKKVCASNEAPMQMIENIFLHRFSRFVENPAVAAVIFSESIFQNDKQLSKKVFELIGKHEEVLTCIISKGQESGDFRNDIPCAHLVHIIIASIRYLVAKWRASEYNFDLVEQGMVLLKNIKLLIKY